MDSRLRGNDRREGANINTRFISVIMPALNEEDNISSAIDDVLSAYNKAGINGEVVVVNDGSSDSTALLADRKAKEFPDKVRVLTHPVCRGIGASFWDGAENARGDAVCMMPGDNENSPEEILKYVHLLDSADIVIPFVTNKEARPALRIFLSFFYRTIVNITFQVPFKYTNGTVIYKKALLENMRGKESGFFFQTALLVRLFKRGCSFTEVPYKLRTRRTGRSKALTLRSLSGTIKGYLRLVKDIYFGK
ncbi:MAG: glycosyltransferase family 2 protein [Candidatus Omnitrophota bacterium]